MFRLKEFVCKPFRKIHDAGKFFHELHDRAVMFRERYADKMMPDKLEQLDDFIGIFTGKRSKRLACFRKLDYSGHHSKAENLFMILKIIMY